MSELLEIRQIEAKRSAHGIPKGELCRKANVARSTYMRRLKAKAGGNTETLRVLNETLKAMIEAKAVLHGQP